MSNIPIEYIWLGGKDEFRSKVRYLPSLLYPRLDTKSLSDLLLTLEWNYDGSSTDQATTEKSEVVLKPVRIYTNQFKNKYYALCETYSIDGQPLSNNYRHYLTKLLEESTTSAHDLWLGFEQEFFLYDLIKRSFLGVTTFGTVPTPQQGPFYCNIEAIHQYEHTNSYLVGSSRVRTLTEKIAQACADLSLGITGWNLEVAPGQTEVQIFGKDLKACDDLMMFRYLCHVILNQENVMPDFSPKPMGLMWNGSGLHTNISTEETRKEGGYDQILKYMKAFEKTHKDHIAVYGKDNHLRLTGIHETSSMDTFTWGVASRATSVRIPRETAERKKGYFEDRRPAANANPYQIALRVLQTIQLANDEKIEVSAA